MIRISEVLGFLNEYYDSEINEKSLETVRVAYQAEANSVDERITEVLKWLNDYNLREDTLVIITADHGEVLGGTIFRDEATMGHVDSLNKHHWNVPLIIANPNRPRENIETPFPLQELSNHLMDRGTK